MSNQLLQNINSGNSLKTSSNFLDPTSTGTSSITATLIDII